MPAPLDRTLIADFPLFDRLDEQAQTAILSRAQARHYEKNDVVFAQDEPAHSFYVLLHGRLRVTQVTPQGAQVVVRFVNPGDLFGVAMALGRTTYPGTATAVVDSLALLWPSSSWPGLISEYPLLAANAMLTIGGRLQEMHKRLQELSTEDAEKRIAHAILKIVHEAGRTLSDGTLIDFPLSRQDIAEMTGTTLHTVSRIMSAWEAAGIVESGRQKITVRNEAKLRSRAESE